METPAFLALAPGAKVVVKRSGKVYQLISATREAPTPELLAFWGPEYYAEGGGYVFRQLHRVKPFGPSVRLKPDDVILFEPEL